MSHVTLRQCHGFCVKHSRNLLTFLVLLHKAYALSGVCSYLLKMRLVTAVLTQSLPDVPEPEPDPEADEHRDFTCYQCRRIQRLEGRAGNLMFMWQAALN